MGFIKPELLKFLKRLFKKLKKKLRLEKNALLFGQNRTSVITILYKINSQ